jgi:hypothetical protein
MNRIFLLSFQLLLFAYFSYAKVLTVSNRTGSSAQYATIAAAISDAIAGDTIYVQGSETDYGNIDLNKRLVFMGPGHNPQKQIALKATIGSLLLKDVLLVVLLPVPEAEATLPIG